MVGQWADATTGDNVKTTKADVTGLYGHYNDDPVTISPDDLITAVSAGSYTPTITDANTVEVTIKSILDGSIYPQSFSLPSDGTSDCTDALNDIADYIKDSLGGMGRIDMPVGTYVINGEVKFEDITNFYWNCYGSKFICNGKSNGGGGLINFANTTKTIALNNYGKTNLVIEGGIWQFSWSPGDTWFSFSNQYDTIGDKVINRGNIYSLATVGGTGRVGPSGTGTGIVDDDAVWDYVAATNFRGMPQPNTAYAVNDTAIRETRVWLVTTAGTTDGTEPSFPSSSDNGATGTTVDWNGVIFEDYGPVLTDGDDGFGSIRISNVTYRDMLITNVGDACFRNTMSTFGTLSSDSNYGTDDITAGNITIDSVTMRDVVSAHSSSFGGLDGVTIINCNAEVYNSIKVATRNKNGKGARIVNNKIYGMADQDNIEVQGYDDATITGNTCDRKYYGYGIGINVLVNDSTGGNAVDNLKAVRIVNNGVSGCATGFNVSTTGDTIYGLTFEANSVIDYDDDAYKIENGGIVQAFVFGPSNTCLKRNGASPNGGLSIANSVEFSGPCFINDAGCDEDAKFIADTSSAPQPCDITLNMASAAAPISGSYFDGIVAQFGRPTNSQDYKWLRVGGAWEVIATAPAAS